MASASRTTLLRQAHLMRASKQLFPTTRGASIAFRSIPSSLSRPSTTSILSIAPRFAPFSTSTQKKILPPGPQVIEGGVNDPAAIPKTSPIHGSYHWTFERGVSIALIPLTIAPFAAGHINAATDAALMFFMIIHSHMGFQYATCLHWSMCTDSVLGPASPTTSRSGNIPHYEKEPTGY